MTFRKIPPVKLEKQPLVLVLCQARFSPVENIKTYMPTIQDEFRKQGYPIQEHRTNMQRAIMQDGSFKEIGTFDQWILKRKDEKASIIVDKGQVLFQTTDYDTFEPFLAKFLGALEKVLALTEHDKFGVIQQLGLRYVDVIQREFNEDELKETLREGFSGVSSKAFSAGTKRMAMETSGRTNLPGGQKGTLVVRLFQNDLGLDIPPDLVADALPRPIAAEKEKLITILDTDHFMAGKFETSRKWVEVAMHGLHDQVIDVFHNHVVTPKALEKWK
jgi:uncharacterized protein (TIGR04255 family)